MLSQLLFVRLRAAENALKDGRLDEAYRLATAPDIREHRRGAAVLAKLTEKFIERARHHYRADRFTEAMMDLDRAEGGGVLKEQIAELRDQVRTVSAELQRREQSRRDRVGAAKRRIEGGSLAAGRKMLEQASANDHDARRLRQAADHRVQDVSTVVEQALSLLGRGQLAAAAERVKRAKSIDAHAESVGKIEARLCKLVLDKAGEAIREGRLSRAANELACLGDLGKTLPAKRELRDLLHLAGDAMTAIRAGRYADARRHALSLARLCPKAKWVAGIVGQLKQLDDIVTSLNTGPLGERLDLSGVDNMRPDPMAERKGPADAEFKRASDLDDTVALPALQGGDGTLPSRLLLLVDGGGSYLILRGGQASIGRTASKTQADVPLYSDVSERHANVTRVDDDYFVFSAKDIDVAGRKTRHQLLRDGDRIVLSRRAKMTFRLPSRKSPTAVLDLSDTTKMPADVRRVVLFHRHATMGCSSTDHIRCQHAGSSLVLFERNGALWVRQQNNGHVDTEPVKLTIGTPVEMAGASFVIEPWRTSPLGGVKT